jgi:hypothetical protein
MIIIWGERLMGKCDTIPGIGHVATRFFHIQFIPFAPVRSFLVFQYGVAPVPAVPIPLSTKSILTAWSRAGFVIGGFFSTLAGFSILCQPRPPVVGGMLLMLVGPVAAILFAGSYLFPPVVKASYERAIRIVEQAHIPPHMRFAVEVAYGRMTAAEADAQSARLQEPEIVVAELVDEPLRHAPR